MGYLKSTGAKLNIGCGAFKKKGYINMDIDPDLLPDVVHDLNKFPYPFDDHAFELVEADHVLEHLESPLRVMKEIHRILRKGGRVAVRVPHFSRGFTHPDHKRGFDLGFPYYFKADFQGGYIGVEYALERQTFHWFAQRYLKKTVMTPLLYGVGIAAGSVIDFFARLSPILCSRLWCYWVGGFEEIEFIFVSKK